MSEDPLGYAAGDTNLYRYCGNSPTNATDPSGQIVFNVGAAGIGAGIGAAVGAGFYTVQTLATGGDFDLGELAIATGAGAATGALAGFTFGGSLLIQGAAMGATGGAIYAGGMSAHDGNSFQQVAYDAALGGAIGAAGGAAGGALGGAILGPQASRAATGALTTG